MGKRNDMEEVEIWATNDMNPDTLEFRIAEARFQNKRVIVFRSGHADLADLTSELLRRNLGLYK